jgi:hypothetical protein
MTATTEIAMTRYADNDPCDSSARLSRRARLHGLLFTGAALGTTLLTVLGGLETKLPPYQGE